MKSVAGATATLLFAASVPAECVTVSGVLPNAPKVVASNGRIRLTTLQDVKALPGVRVFFYLAHDEAHPKLTFTTDNQGMVLATGLAPGQYRVIAVRPEQETTEILLEVKHGAGSETNSYLVKVPPTFLPEKPAAVEAAAITETVKKFEGRVLDPSGAVVPGALVQVYRKEAPNAPVAKIKAGQDGSFSEALSPGRYVVFVTSQGFFKKVIGFDIVPRAERRNFE
jgi:hypothetical protein